ncbi:MAG: hypothetical protein QOH76_3473, partial [Thermoleophilaceae bacterium]|nr:hypothetical protein [Thermoleophilaceae bacterium]
GDVGAPASPAPWWISPDVDIPAHSGEAGQGSNDVQIRVHTHEEPFIDEKIVAEVYVGMPGFVLSPTVGTKRIDPGNLLFRPPNVAGTEPVADVAGGTLTFPWTPSSTSANPDGPGHRCLIVRAFPQSVQPPTTPFDVPNEGHEAQHNIEVLSTTKKFAGDGGGGAGTPGDPKHRDKETGMWWEELVTMAAGDGGRRYFVWAFDPQPSKELIAVVRGALGEANVDGFSDSPPDQVSLAPVDAKGEEMETGELLNDGGFVERSGVGNGLFAKELLLRAAWLDLEPDSLAKLVLSFDHSNIAPGTAVVLHGAQWTDAGRPEGGMTVVAVAPV